MTRIETGEVLERRVVETVRGSQVAIPEEGRLTHLQFRRFAGCPMCNLHVRSFVRRHEELERRGVREVVVFHSSKAALLEHQGEAPFALVADPEKSLYREFGVESSVWSVLHPGAWLPALKGMFAGRMGLPGKGESPLGLPADFLLDADGRVVACKYGRHAYDHWSVDEVLELADEAVAAATGADGRDHRGGHP